MTSLEESGRLHCRSHSHKRETVRYNIATSVNSGVVHEELSHRNGKVCDLALEKGASSKLLQIVVYGILFAEETPQ